MARSPDSLDTSCLDLADVANFALQRTHLILDWPLLGRKGTFLFWHFFGWLLPLKVEMALRRRAVLHRGAADIHREFVAIRDRLKTPPRRICDIGCGLGHLDIFLADAFPVEEILLVDIESSATHRHNFNREGSGYNSLVAAGRFVRANVPATTAVATCNPRADDLLAHATPSFDLVVSLLSCGYHYPTDEYVEFFRNGIPPGGILILDLRHKVTQNDLSDLFDVAGTIEETDRYRRTIFRRR